MSSVSVPCRRCGKTAPADSFVMSHELRQMICPTCAKHFNKQPSQADKHEPRIRNEYKPLFPSPSAKAAPKGEGSIEPAKKPVRNEYKPSFSSAFKDGSKLSGQKPQQNAVTPASSNPPGWDDEDEKLLRMAKREERRPAEIGDSYSCGSCGYKFKRSATVGKVYTKCPFCGKPIN